MIEADGEVDEEVKQELRKMANDDDDELQELAAAVYRRRFGEDPRE